MKVYLINYFEVINHVIYSTDILLLKLPLPTKPAIVLNISKVDPYRFKGRVIVTRRCGVSILMARDRPTPTI